MVSYRCKNCMWFDFREPANLIDYSTSLGLFGLCRKKWPIVILDKAHHYISNWVFVREEDFCGEFMPNKEGKDGMSR